jgi:hypothetical protein
MEIAMRAARRWLAVTLATLSSATACNYTVGECYPRGQSDGSAGVGGGVLLPSGVGGYGDTPPQPQGGTGAAACNDPGATEPEPDESADALDTWVHCRGLDVVECMIKCAQEGAPCTPRERHPYKAEGGWGDLYMCKNGVPSQVCSYYYSSGDECAFFKAFGRKVPICVYVGGKP